MYLHSLTFWPLSRHLTNTPDRQTDMGGNQLETKLSRGESENGTDRYGLRRQEMIDGQAYVRNLPCLDKCK